MYTEGSLMYTEGSLMYTQGSLMYTEGSLMYLYCSDNITVNKRYLNWTILKPSFFPFFFLFYSGLSFILSVVKTFEMNINKHIKSRHFFLEYLFRTIKMFIS